MMFHGHQAGDEVLVRLAERVGQVVRRHEMLFRLGGDEFAILVSDSEPSSLDELARRVVSTVAEARFEFAGHSVSVTVSVGYASFPEHANDATSLVAAADEAMYCAKAAGRNRWVAYSSEKKLMQRSYSDAVGDQPFSHRDCGIALYERMPTIETVIRSLATRAPGWFRNCNIAEVPDGTKRRTSYRKVIRSTVGQGLLGRIVAS